MKRYKKISQLSNTPQTLQPTQQSQREYFTENNGGVDVSRNIRHYDRPSIMNDYPYQIPAYSSRIEYPLNVQNRNEALYAPQYYQQSQTPSQVPQQYYYPQIPQQQIKTQTVITCNKIEAHIKECSKCSKIYRKNVNTYIMIIIGLILFIMFLITKIVDKY